MIHHIKPFVTKKLPLLIVATVVVLSSVAGSSLLVNALSLSDQIRQKEAEKAEAQAEADRLGGRAKSIEEQIEDLQTQIAGIQAKIETNVRKQNELTKDIKAAQKRLKEQKGLLSANIRSMYIEGDISPLEMIASSRNISDFVAKQEYRDRLKEAITSTMDEIEGLKKKLAAQKKEVTRILKQQESLRDSLRVKNNEADRKLAQVKDTRASFNRVVARRTNEIQQLQAQQAAIEQARNQWTGGYISSGGTGGYPWANAPIDPNWGISLVVDSWGLYARQCTSYVAWKLSSQGYGVRHFNGQGNANEWPSTTASYTSQRVGSPRVGDAAVQYLGVFGHVMFVESVNGDGSITISEYNWIPNSFSQRKIYQGEYSSYTFITFPRR